MAVAVIGAGSWGTALSQVLASKGNEVRLWARREEAACEINETHVNARYLPGAKLSESVLATSSMACALDDARACVLVAPSAHVRAVAHEVAPHLADDVPVVVCSKGVEAETGLLMTQVLAEEVGHPERLAVLSGPTHAEEVVKAQPSACVIASSNASCAEAMVELFRTPEFRTYASSDPVGVELCGAFKNVIAIAVGVSYGMGYGDNTAAMLITRGLAEMGRMVVACGGQALTCMGLAGAGDMVVTCMSRHSRNRRFGEDYLAQGRTLADFEEDTHMVVEGAISCRTLDVLSKRHGVELPLTDSVWRIIQGDARASDVAESLLSRSARPEFYGMDC